MFRLRWPWHSATTTTTTKTSGVQIKPLIGVGSRGDKVHVIHEIVDKPKNLILSGGSLKGVSFIGCIKRLEEMDAISDIKNMIGTSFGSLVLFMLTIGCTSDDMIENIVFCLSQKQKVKKSMIKTLIHCIEYGGIDDGGVLLECMKRPLIQKLERSDITFLELAKLTGKNLIVTGSNLTYARPEYFSVDTTPNMSVILALRISASIPFLFRPVSNEGSLYVDGALFDNFPIDAWLKEPNTLGIVIMDDIPTNSTPSKSTTLSDLIFAMWQSVLARLNPTHHSSNGLVTIIKIPSRDVVEYVNSSSSLSYSFETMSFHITIEEVSRAVKFGYLSCCKDSKEIDVQDPNDCREDDSCHDSGGGGPLVVGAPVIEDVKSDQCSDEAP